MPLPHHLRDVAAQAALLIVGLSSLSSGNAGDQTPEAEAYASHQTLKPFAEFVADVGDRMRRVVYTPHPVSATHGVIRSFVHVSDGSAVLSRIDLVVDGDLPIVFRRSYHSRRTHSADFGETGWHLTLAERIEQQNGNRFVYTYGNGATLEFDRKGRLRSMLHAQLSDVLQVVFKDQQTIEVLTRAGLTKRFDRKGDAYRLRRVKDAYQSWLAFEYARSGQLERIHGSSGAWLGVSRDNEGRIIAIKDSHQRVVRYAYDAMGRLVTITDPGDADWQYDYDPANRLVATTTPNAMIDVEFHYDTSGRVSTSRMNGTRSSFDYHGRQTKVTDSHGTTAVYAAASSGLTTEVTNAFGTTTALRMDRKGRPEALIRNSVTVAQFSYDQADDTAIDHATYASPASGEAYNIAYDRNGRIRSATTAGGGRGYQVERYGSAWLPERIVYTDGTREEADFGAEGRLKRLLRSNGNELSFERLGAQWRIADTHDRQVDLQFDSVGRLELATTPDGHEMKFGYNATGLRESTELSYGAVVRYQYDASGSIYYSASGYSDREIPGHTYVFGDDHRITAVHGTAGDAHEYAYGPSGLLVGLRSSVLTRDVMFAYDEFGRLTSVEYEGTTREHRYSADEPDIVAQAGVRRIPVFNQQREISDFASWFDVALTRIQPASFGLITYDEVRHELTFPADPASWNPMSPLTSSISALRIEALLDDEGNGVQQFNIPSNRLFVPREYWSVNCCVCVCSDPNIHCDPY